MPPLEQAMSRLADLRPDKAGRAWLTGEKRVISFGELSDRIGRVAALLRRYKVALGDRVVIATEDDSEAAMLFVAMVSNGATVVQLDPATGAERARALTAKVAPALIILDASLSARWALEQNCPVIEIAPPAPKRGLFGGRAGKAPLQGLLAELQALDPVAPPATIPPETLAYILFTSGTTFEPKGVAISHRALFSHLATLARVQGMTAESRILNTLMLSHADGMIQGPMFAFFTGAQLYRPMKFEITTLDALLDCVFQLRITHMIAVPTMLSLMTRLGGHAADAFKGGDFRLLVSCGAALEPGLWEEFETRFGVDILNIYGLTETVVGGVFAGGSAGKCAYGSIGTPIDCELRIVGEDGVDVAGGETGELLMRGSLLMSGYYADAGQSAAVLENGWLRTGDIARRDTDGHYWICGRKKNIVIRGGLNINPEEVTEALNRHPAVADAVAFGAPDPVWGETLLALAVAPGLTEAELLDHCARLLEPRKVPGAIRIVDALPKGRSGKVILAEARALFEERRQGSTTAGDGNDNEARLIAVAARVFKLGGGSIRISATPAEILGWDSLAHIEFVTAIEDEFGIVLTPRQIMGLTHIGKALDYLRA